MYNEYFWVIQAFQESQYITNSVVRIFNLRGVCMTHVTARGTKVLSLTNQWVVSKKEWFVQVESSKLGVATFDMNPTQNKWIKADCKHVSDQRGLIVL